MSHSHLAIRHLVRKLELTAGQPVSRRPLPARITELVERVAELFEPFSGVARVGYECQQHDDGWELALFLGEHEQVGGAGDGEMRPVNFQFDVLPLAQLLDRVDSLRWNAFPNSYSSFDNVADLSMLCLTGQLGEWTIRLQVHAGPLEAVGPALREYGDGRWELA